MNPGTRATYFINSWIIHLTNRIGKRPGGVYDAFRFHVPFFSANLFFNMNAANFTIFVFQQSFYFNVIGNSCTVSSGCHRDS